MLPKILWISSDCEKLARLAGPVVASARYDFIAVADGDQALSQLLTHEWAAVLMEPVNLPPGNSALLKHLYFDRPNIFRQQLGWAVLYLLLKPKKLDHNLGQPIPAWLTSSRFGIFTTATQPTIQNYLEELDIKVYKQITARTSSDTLLRLADQITGYHGR